MSEPRYDTEERETLGFLILGFNRALGKGYDWYGLGWAQLKAAMKLFYFIHFVEAQFSSGSYSYQNNTKCKRT